MANIRHQKLGLGIGCGLLVGQAGASTVVLLVFWFIYEVFAHAKLG